MNAIHQLPDQVVNQIAAGEVVERPASVVKELVENSIDAGATQIKVYIENGGKKLIRVIDNGSGITKDDLFNATKQHWTSKIDSVDDLISINTMGFRGEALASICAVSRFTLSSRVATEEHGWEYVADDTEVSTRPIGMPIGTEVTVKDLFHNVPARLNFLKSEQTESAHVLLLMQQLALSHPQISFTLNRNGSEVLATKGDGNISSIIPLVIGKELASRMISITSEHPHMRIYGFVGQPGMGTSGRPRQFVFVNSRPVENNIVRAAVHKAYGSLLGRGEKPQYVIMLDIAPHLVDFNVHPQKKEVRFVDSNPVFQLILQAVKQGITGYNPVSTTDEQPRELRKTVTERSDELPMMYRPVLSDPMRSGISNHRVEHEDEIVLFEPTSHATHEPTETPKLDIKPKSKRRFQLHNLFIVEEIDDGIMVYDQHAVHERVLYEQFSKQYLDRSQDGAIQALLVPQTLELTPIEFASWQNANETLTALGFIIKKLDTNTIEVRQIPAVLSSLSIRKLLSEYLLDLVAEDEIDVHSELPEIDNQTHRRLAYMACRGAIKAGDSLTPLEIDRLLEDYAKTELRYTCPHGRPVQVKISKDEMEKWFRR